MEQDLSFRKFVWKTANGESISIQDMDTFHINNCIALLKRNKLKELKNNLPNEKKITLKLKEAEEAYGQLKAINMNEGSMIALEIKAHLMGEYNKKTEITEEDIENGLNDNRAYQCMMKELQYRIIEQKEKLKESFQNKESEKEFFEKKCDVTIINIDPRPEGIPLYVYAAVESKENIKIVPGDYLGSTLNVMRITNVHKVVAKSTKDKPSRVEWGLTINAKNSEEKDLVISAIESIALSQNNSFISIY